jgi:hypothetical protein
MVKGRYGGEDEDGPGAGCVICLAWHVGCVKAVEWSVNCRQDKGGTA